MTTGACLQRVLRFKYIKFVKLINKCSHTWRINYKKIENANAEYDKETSLQPNSWT